MTNSIAEIEKTKIILVTGSNTTENHPVIGAAIKRAVTHHGAKLIVADPREIELTGFADCWLRQTSGTDIAWINGLMHIIIAEDRYDKDYVAERTEGFEELKKALESFTPEFVSRTTGIPEKDLYIAARLYASDRAGIFYTMGITQHSHGTDNVKALANLSMLCGNIGYPGAGVNPLRGQNNVQGACDMGGLPNVFTAYQPVTSPEARALLEKEWGVTGIPEKPGLTLMEMTHGMAKKTIRGAYIMGENPVVSDPDSAHILHALEAVDFLVVQDIFLTETATLADVVLPGASFAEKDGTFTNTERRVQRVRKAIEPVGGSEPDWRIISEISSRMGLPMQYPDAETIFEEIRRVTPSYAGITYDRIEEKGLQWPCPSEDHPGTPYLHKNRFTRGLGKFHVIPYTGAKENPDAEYPFILTTGRVLYHYHTGTMTRKSSGLNHLAPECMMEISEKDAKKLNILTGDKVSLRSRRGEIAVKAEITDRIPEGTVFIPFHYAEAAANRLTSTALDPAAKIPELKVCAVRVEKIG